MDNNEIAKEFTVHLLKYLDMEKIYSGKVDVASEVVVGLYASILKRLTAIEKV